MQMHEQMMIVDGQEQPISRTYQYRKVMKPMLERKRRARINRCLDELKDLMVTALAGDGENVAKLEKADILELTVRHLHKLQRQQRLSANPVIDADRFRAGYTHCANEVSRCLAATPGVDVALGTKLMTHLGHKLNAMDKTGPLTIHVTAPQTSPSTRSEVSSRSSSVSSSSSSTASDDYAMPLTPASSQPSPIRNELETTNVHQQSSSPHHHHQGLLQVATLNKSVWRPW